MSLWKGLMSLCMVWLNCFVFSFAWFFWGVRPNVCCCVCFYFWGPCSPFYQSVNLHNLLSPPPICFNPLLFLLLLLLRPLSSSSAESIVCQSCHSCFKVDKSNEHTHTHGNTTPASSLKSPLPLTYPAGDWGVTYLTDDLAYWELHRTLLVLARLSSSTGSTHHWYGSVRWTVPGDSWLFILKKTNLCPSSHFSLLLLFCKLTDCTLMSWCDEWYWWADDRVNVGELCRFQACTVLMGNICLNKKRSDY